MSKKNLIKLLKAASTVIVSAGTGHYVTKVLNHSEDLARIEAEKERAKKYEQMIEYVKDIKSKLDSQCNKIEKTENNNIPTELYNKMVDLIESIKSEGTVLKKVLEEGLNEKFKEEAEKVVQKMDDSMDALDKIVNNLPKDGNKFIPDFNLQPYYDFLDSLTLFEESAFLNIFIYYTVNTLLLSPLSTLSLLGICIFYKCVSIVL